jgi:hypothetical protein
MTTDPSHPTGERACDICRDGSGVVLATINGLKYSVHCPGAAHRSRPTAHPLAGLVTTGSRWRDNDDGEGLTASPSPDGSMYPIVTRWDDGTLGADDYDSFFEGCSPADGWPAAIAAFLGRSRKGTPWSRAG